MIVSHEHKLPNNTAKHPNTVPVNEPVASQATLRKSFRGEFGWFMTISLLVCAVAISSQSYWIDEAINVYRATLPTLVDLWRFLRAEGNANLQVPLYYVFAWAWEKLVGPNEFPMRAGNAIWFIAGLAVLLNALKGNRELRLGIGLALLVSPFAWYYLDEARPYMLQLSTSLMVFASLFRLGLCQNSETQERRWLIVLSVGSLLLAASGLFAMLWLGSYLAGALLSASASTWKKLFLNHWDFLIPPLVLLFTLGLYYLWTLTLGARATGGNMDLKTAMFIPYELLGFSGLGPGRISLRENGPAVLREWVPLIGFYAIVQMFVLWAGWRYISSMTSVRTRLCWCLAFGSVALFIFLMCVAVKFRVLGRHAMPLLPLVLFVVGAGIAGLLKLRNLPGRILMVVFVALSLASALSLRFAPRHAKDDYRRAAALGRAALARGEVVWWNAARDGALIYHVAVADKPGSGAALYMMNPPSAVVRELPKPNLILASKPDIYDQEGILKQYIAHEGFMVLATFPAFTAWGTPAKK
jgi:hypothetical protein